MRLFDGGAMSFTAIVRYPLRSAMLLVAISIGVAAVLLLTSLGEGARRYVTSQFNNLGSPLFLRRVKMKPWGWVRSPVHSVGHRDR